MVIYIFFYSCSMGYTKKNNENVHSHNHRYNNYSKTEYQLTEVIFDGLDHESIKAGSLHAFNQIIPHAWDCGAIYRPVPLIQYHLHKVLILRVIPSSCFHKQTIIKQQIGKAITLS